jgi:hypothetical protein
LVSCGFVSGLSLQCAAASLAQMGLCPISTLFGGVEGERYDGIVAVPIFDGLGGIIVGGVFAGERGVLVVDDGADDLAVGFRRGRRRG